MEPGRAGPAGHGSQDVWPQVESHPEPPAAEPVRADHQKQVLRRRQQAAGCRRQLSLLEAARDVRHRGFGSQSDPGGPEAADFQAFGAVRFYVIFLFVFLLNLHLSIYRTIY